MTSRTDHNDPHNGGALALTYHYEMLSDPKRLVPFVKAIQELCAGKVVFESGTGSGVLSILAAKAGAKQVFCTEIDPKVAQFARANIERSGCKDRITLFERSTLDVTLADLGNVRPDVLMAENLSTWQVTEPENQVMNHLRATLAHTQTISVPGKTFNYVQLVYSQFRFLDAVELRTHFFEFTGIPRAAERSDAALFSTFDYSRRNDVAIAREITIPVTSSGVVNSLRLTSPLEVSPGNLFDASDSLMPPVVVPLPKDIMVEAGTTLVIRIEYRTNTAWEEFTCDARPPI